MLPLHHDPLFEIACIRFHSTALVIMPVLSFLVVEPRVELSITRLSAECGQPVLDAQIDERAISGGTFHAVDACRVAQSSRSWAGRCSNPRLLGFGQATPSQLPTPQKKKSPDVLATPGFVVLCE